MWLFVFVQGPPPPPGQLKFTVADTCDRIKEEFNFLQAQYHRQVISTDRSLIETVAGAAAEFISAGAVARLSFPAPRMSSNFSALVEPKEDTKKNTRFTQFSAMTLFFSLSRSLKLECEKLASEKTEMQRHYVMVRDLRPRRSRFARLIRRFSFFLFFSLLLLLLLLPSSRRCAAGRRHTAVLRDVVRTQRRNAQTGENTVDPVGMSDRRREERSPPHQRFHCSDTAILLPRVSSDPIHTLPPT